MLRRLSSLSLAALLVTLPVVPAHAAAYDGKPRLVVLLVIDQFREDYLERYRADLKAQHGFRLFLDHGAYFPDCYYDYANTKTAPGHATLGTGAYTDGHGISANQWWDLARNKTRPISSVEDERYKIVGLLNARADAVGASPRNERASTLGDELRLATIGQSRVFGVSLKDRAAILPAGQSANAAYWIDAQTGSFITSNFYQNALPEWATTFNAGPRAQQALDEAHGDASKSFFSQVETSTAGNSYEIDFARALITGEQLGHHATTDMLTLSLSANDGLGHKVGPDAPQMRDMLQQLDQQLDGFFTWLDKNVDGGLANVWIALSADHGIASTPEQATSLGMNAATWDLPRMIASLNDALNLKYSPGERLDYLLEHQELPYIQLNQPAFERAGINEQEAEDAILALLAAAIQGLPAQPPVHVPMGILPPATAAGSVGSAGPETAARTGAKGRLSRAEAARKTKETAAPPSPPTPQPLQPAASKLAPQPALAGAYTRVQLAAGALPPDQFGQLLAHSYSSNGGWYVMLIPEAYQMEGNAAGTGTTHYSAWSYDRHVPLAFYGAPFQPGIYRGRVAPVDLAATFASLLGVNQPSASVGQVLTQSLRATTATSAEPAARAATRGAGARGARKSRPAAPETPAEAAPDAHPEAPAATPSATPPTTPPETLPEARPETPPAAPPATPAPDAGSVKPQ